MAEPILVLGVCGDRHIGNSAYDKIDPDTRLNIRTKDSYVAYRETVMQMIEHGVDAVIDTGDLFHKSHPSVRDIVTARNQLMRLSKVGIPVYGISGNHDASNDRGRFAATQAVHDPSRGLYYHNEIATESTEIVPGQVMLHRVSHYGLAAAEPEVPEPVDGMINLAVLHGSVVSDSLTYHTEDSPAEQFIGSEVMDNPGWNQILLGHFHSMGKIADNAWYTGSAFRRGFSDAPGQSRLPTLQSSVPYVCRPLEAVYSTPLWPKPCLRQN